VIAVLCLFIVVACLVLENFLRVKHARIKADNNHIRFLMPVAVCAAVVGMMAM